MTQTKRVARKSKTEVDLTKPIGKMKVKEEDCFGKEWSLDAKECNHCADCEVCGILFDKAQRTAVKESGEVYLDTTDFEGINKDGLSIWLTLKERTVQELYDKIAKESGCPDEETVVLWLKSFIKEYNFKTKEGVVYAK